MSTQIDFNIILVITLLLIVIILLSGVKICKIPLNLNKALNDRFIDTRYNYISEPFDIVTDPMVYQVGDIAVDSINQTLTQTVDQEKQNKQINGLMDQISNLENKIKVLDQIW